MPHAAATRLRGRRGKRPTPATPFARGAPNPRPNLETYIYIDTSSLDVSLVPQATPSVALESRFWPKQDLGARSALLSLSLSLWGSLSRGSRI